MRYIITFLILFVNWVIWSGKFDAFHLALGVISCLIVTYTTHNLLFRRTRFSSKDITEVIRLFTYIPWLIYQIVLANIHVASLVLNPKMPIDPRMIKFKTKLKKDISLTTFANSITLTPGTITADIIDGEFYVHALNKKVADDLLSGEMEKRIAHVFSED
jgi:multicomponent Na+:H+ antiporter subunit E